jgi:hypothetical protein
LSTKVIPASSTARRTASARRSAGFSSSGRLQITVVNPASASAATSPGSICGDTA